MIKIRKIKALMFSLLFLNLMTIFFSFNALSLPTSWYSLDDFDTYSIDDNFGDNGDLNWTTMVGNDGIIRGAPLGDKYLLFGTKGTVDTHSLNVDLEQIWFNASNNHSGYYVKEKTSGTYTGDWMVTYYNWKNSTTNETVVSIKSEDKYTANDCKISYYNGNTYVVLYYGDLVNGKTIYISWEWYTDNIIQYKVLKSDETLIAMDNDTGCNTSLDTQNDYNVSDCYITIGAGTPTSEDYTIIYDYGVVYEVLDLPDYFYPDLGLASRCSNPIGGYSTISQITYTGSVDWGCVALHFLWDRTINDCFSSTWDTVPAKYVEHRTDSFYNERIRHVLLPISAEQKNLVSDNVNSYQLIISDPENSTSMDCGTADYLIPYSYEYALVWENVNYSINGRPVFAFSCSQQTSGLAKDWYWYGLAGFYGGLGSTLTHNSAFNFYDGQLTGTPDGNFKLSVCWYYDNSSLYNETNPYDLPIIEDYDDIYGSGDTGKGYIEFYGIDYPCYYRIGGVNTIPKIVFNLTGFGAGNGTKTLIYYIYKVINGSDDEIVYYDFIEVVNRDYYRGIRELIDFNDGLGFTSSGKYYIICYNTTDYGTTTTDFVHRSDTLTVCPKLPSGGSNQIEPDYYGLPYWVPWIIGIFITLFVTISPLIIAIYVSRKTKAVELPKIPGLLYVGFFFMGLTISVIIGFLPSYLPFVILFGMIVFFGIDYYRKKNTSSEGE